MSAKVERILHVQIFFFEINYFFYGKYLFLQSK
jgi:hypothetical protein